MDDKEQKDFLALTGYRTMRKRMMCSCNLKDFLQLIETKIFVKEDGSTDEEELV